MSSLARRRWTTVTGMAATVVLGLALPAAAHVTVTPPTAPAGALTLYTLQVPNELADQAAVGIDVTLPTGFALDVAQSVPGWQTVITRKGGAPVAVSWKGGRIPVGTFASFELQGRNPTGQGVLRWPAVQRYERTTIAWNGPATSEHAVPTVRLGPAGTAAAAAATGAAPSSVGPGPTAGDPLARSRAALGIALGVAAVGLALGPWAVAALRRRSARTEPHYAGVVVEDQEPVAEARVRTAAPTARNTRAPTRSGHRRG